MDMTATLEAPCTARDCSSSSTICRRIRCGTAWSTAADPSSRATPPAWDVELRARLGPLARSKRLRMVRTARDGRDHAVGSNEPGRRPQSCAVGADAAAIVEREGPQHAEDAPALRRRVVDRWCAGAGAGRSDHVGSRAAAAARGDHALKRPSSRLLQRQWHPEALAEVGSEVNVLSIGPAATTSPVAEHHHVGHARRDLVEVVGHQHQRRERRVDGQLAQGWTSCSRPPRSRRALGSSSSTMPGSFISVRASSTRCCSPDEAVASGSIGEPGRHPSGRGRRAPGPRRRRRSGATTVRARRTWRSSRRRGSAARVGAGRPAPPTCSRCGGAVPARRCDPAARRARGPSPPDGCSYIAAMRSSVVLPEPLAPSTTQRWPGAPPVSGARIVRPSRTKLTSVSCTSAELRRDDMEVRRSSPLGSDRCR